MRGIAYGIAAIAAIGIMYVIATSPDAPNQQTASNAEVSVVPTSADVMAEAGTLTLSVPEMSCEFACFPRVKQTLEEATGVAEVALAEQKEEGVLDNKQVIVQYEPGFDVQSAIASLESAGFTDTNIVP